MLILLPKELHITAQSNAAACVKGVPRNDGSRVDTILRITAVNAIGIGSRSIKRAVADLNVLALFAARTSRRVDGRVASRHVEGHVADCAGFQTDAVNTTGCVDRDIGDREISRTG